MKAKVYLPFAVMCLIFGTTFLTIKIGLDAGFSPFLFSGLRFFLAGIILIVILTARGRPVPRTVAFWSRGTLIGILMVVVAFGALFWGTQCVDSSIVAQIHVAEPVMIAVLSALLLKKAFGAVQIVGIVAATAGSALLVGFAGFGAQSDNPALAVAGAIAVIVAQGGYALGSVLFSRLFGDKDDPIAVNAVSMTMGGAILLIISLFEGPRFAVSLEGIASLVYLTVLGSLVAHSIFLWVVRESSAVFASTWMYISPVIATILGVWLLNEAFSIMSLVGAATIFVGVFLIHKTETRVH